jgi:hypothetical protein
VNPGEPIRRRAPIVYEILAYLVDHPEAQDTVEGIVAWWVLEQRLKRQTSRVKEALAELVAGESVIARRRRDARIS